MGADIKELLDARNNILDEIIDRLQAWDKTTESGIGIIESNQASLDKLKSLNAKVIDLEISSELNEEYNFKLNLIIKELENLTKVLRGKKDELVEDKQQLNKKEQVINSYISINKQPIFIDKDVV